MLLLVLLLLLLVLFALLLSFEALCRRGFRGYDCLSGPLLCCTSARHALPRRLISTNPHTHGSVAPV